MRESDRLRQVIRRMIEDTDELHDAAVRFQVQQARIAFKAGHGTRWLPHFLGFSRACSLLLGLLGLWLGHTNGADDGKERDGMSP